MIYGMKTTAYNAIDVEKIMTGTLMCANQNCEAESTKSVNNESGVYHLCWLCWYAYEWGYGAAIKEMKTEA